MSRILAFIACLFIVACDDARIRPADPEPVAANCDPACFDKCSTSDIQWRSDPNVSAAWDDLVDEVTLPLIADVAVCDARRAACAACLGNLKRRRVIQ